MSIDPIPSHSIYCLVFFKNNLMHFRPCCILLARYSQVAAGWQVTEQGLHVFFWLACVLVQWPLQYHYRLVFGHDDIWLFCTPLYSSWTFRLLLISIPLGDDTHGSHITLMLTICLVTPFRIYEFLIMRVLP